MKQKKCPTCDQIRNEDEYYTHLYKGFRKPDFSSCKVCRKVKAREQKKIRDAKMRSQSCNGCNRKFGKKLKPASRGYCASCYENIRDVKDGTCKTCSVVFGRGRSRHLSKGLCARCYESWYRNQIITNCKKCNEKLDKPSVKGLCYLCKEEQRMIAEQKLIEKGLLAKRRTEGVINRNEFHMIRMLLVKFKWGYYDIVDTFQVASIYDKLYGGHGMDTKPVEVQLVLMLRRLKDVYERNKEKFNI